MARPCIDTWTSFEAKVDRSGGPDACHPWTAARTESGYGTFKKDGRQTSAHIWAYEFKHGPVPDGYQLDHLCHTRDLACSGGPTCPHRRCCNARHLEPVTARENIAVRGRGLAARNLLVTHCPQGHPYDEINTYRRRDGRGCRACRAESSRKHHLTKRQGARRMSA